MLSNYLKLHFFHDQKSNALRVLLSLKLCLLLSACGVTYSGGLVLGGSGTSSSSAQQPPSITHFTSKERLKEIGAEQHAEIIREMSLYEDELLLQYVREIGSIVLEGSDELDIGYQIFILDTMDVNAFAAPGGYLYLTRGILSLLNSEAQLAAIIGHEIAHVAANHHARTGTRDILARGAAEAAGLVTGIATGSNSVGYEIAQLGAIWAATATAGFSRELELEADGLSARYLLGSGYDPQSMFEALSVLKSNEDFYRVQLGRRNSYHGSFASHPRTDLRLQVVINQVSQFGENQVARLDNAKFRDHIDGITFGPSSASQRMDQRNRYYQDLLGYTVVFPDDWLIEDTPTTVTASKPNVGKMRIGAIRSQGAIEPRVFIRDTLGVENLQKSEPLSQFRLEGHTGTALNPETGQIERIAALNLGPRVFVFRGEVADNSQSGLVDEMLLESIKSFRAIQQGEVVEGSEVKIKYVQASEFFDFSIVAQQETTKFLQTAAYAATSPAVQDLQVSIESVLRLINGYYPIGSPEPGEWIKLIEGGDSWVLAISAQSSQ